MKFRLFIIIWFIGTVFSFSQTDSTKIPFVAYWSKGDSYNFKITKVTKHWQNNKLVNNDSYTYLANFSVIDSGNNFYKIKWKYEPNLSSFLIPKALQENIKTPETIKVIYTTNEAGGFLNIENWLEISETANEVFDDFISQNSNLKPQIEPILQMFNSEQGIKVLLLKELHYFHLLMGFQYDVNNPFVGETKINTPFNSELIRSDVKISIDKIDYDNSLYFVTHQSKANPEDCKKLIKGILEQMKFEDIKDSEYDINHLINYEYNFDLGIPKYINSEKNAILKVGNIDTKQLETIKIEFVKS